MLMSMDSVLHIVLARNVHVYEICFTYRFIARNVDVYEFCFTYIVLARKRAYKSSCSLL